MSARPDGVALRRKRELRLHEQTIENAQKSFIEMGRALGKIRAEDLYVQAGFKTFEAYLETRWDITPQHAYRLISAARTALILSPMGYKITSERVARELLPVASDQETMVAVYAEAERRAPEGRVTAAIVAQVRAELAPDADVIDGELVPERLELEGTPQTAATEVGVSPVAAPTAVDDVPLEHPDASTDGDEGGPFAPHDSPAGDGPGAERPVPGNPHDTPAAAVDQVALVAQQPGLPDLPEARTPEGPVERNVAAPGIPSPSFEGSDNGDGLEEGRDLPARPSSSDPSTVVQMFRAWVETVDDLDPDALGPLLDDGDMKTLHRCVDDLAHFVGLLERWRTP